MISILQNEVERLRPASSELAAAVEQFLAAGGKIEEGPASGYIPKPINYSNQMPPAPKPFVRRRTHAAALPLDPIDARHDERVRKAETVKALAATHTQTEVSAALGMTSKTLRDLAKDFGFVFKRSNHGGHFGPVRKKEIEARDAKYAEHIKAFKEQGISRRVVCGKLAISNRTLQRILDEYGIEYPKARRCSNSCAA
ncbi:hypothetical protein C4K03_3786 [Pseudomonas synxantha]|uniref:Uncharacterized protein n=1 Tax=Pseudomonas synxantha TaxID=47883 RepID=A0A3G7UBN1_9PSED|nr:hypothetical protein [Pseudomonas synxantha]AZE55939.1 hypothetical protein C4K03_3786 [Pseudomonas synxantha]